MRIEDAIGFAFLRELCDPGIDRGCRVDLLDDMVAHKQRSVRYLASLSIHCDQRCRVLDQELHDPMLPSDDAPGASCGGRDDAPMAIARLRLNAATSRIRAYP